jgi:hypothetical protein
MRARDPQRTGHERPGEDEGPAVDRHARERDLLRELAEVTGERAAFREQSDQKKTPLEEES